MAEPTDIYIDSSLQQKIPITGGITNTLNTAHVNQPSHGYITNDFIKILSSTRPFYNGIWQITKIDDNNYDYTMINTPSGPATGSPTESPLTGDGTEFSPFEDLQHALNTVVHDTVNGDRFNLKSGTVEKLTKNLAVGGVKTNNAPFVLEGYDTIPGDGGECEIDGVGQFSLFDSPTADFFVFKNIYFHNSGSSRGVRVDDFCAFIQCRFENILNDGLTAGERCVIINCSFKDITGIGVQVAKLSRIFFNYFKNIGSKALFLSLLGNNGLVYRNIFSLSGITHAIEVSSEESLILSNSFFTTGSGKGILLTLAGLSIKAIMNNVFEGFSSSIDLTAQNEFTTRICAHNATYSSSYNFNEHIVFNADNEILTSSPFAKTGQDNFINRFNYFAPVNIGNIQGGSYPTSRRMDKGAVQGAVAGGVDEQSGGTDYRLIGAM